MTSILNDFAGIRNILWSFSVLGLTLAVSGCYTQLGTGYYQDYYSQSEPDYEEITVYETEEGDSVVVDRYFTNDVYSGTRYRRYFSRFHGVPYAHYDPFYDWYDPFYDGWGYGHSSLYLSFGWGSPWHSYYSPYGYGWGWSRYSPVLYGYYPSYYGGYGYYPGGYYGSVYRFNRYAQGNYGPRGSRVGRGSVLAGGNDRGRSALDEDYLRTYGRAVGSTTDRNTDRSRLGVSRANGSNGLRTVARGRTDSEEPDSRTLSRRGVVNSSGSSGTSSTRGTRIVSRTSTRGSTGRVSTTRRTTISRSVRPSSSSSPTTRARPTSRTRSTTQARPSSSTRPTTRARPSSSTRPTTRARPSSSSQPSRARPSSSGSSSRSGGTVSRAPTRSSSPARSSGSGSSSSRTSRRGGN